MPEPSSETIAQGSGESSDSEILRTPELKKPRRSPRKRKPTQKSRDLGLGPAANAAKKPCHHFEDGAPITSMPVTILVGEEESRFYVHAELLKASSAYFLAVPGAELEDDKPRTIKLLDADADAFTFYAKWLYSGRFHVTDSEELRAPGTSQKDLHWDDLSACYALAGSLQSLDFADATIDAMIRRMLGDGDSPDDLAKWIYPKATKDSVHRTLCRDISIHTWARSKLDELWEDGFPQEFVKDVFTYATTRLESVVKREDVVTFLKTNATCDYHEHKRLGLPCYKTSFGY